METRILAAAPSANWRTSIAPSASIPRISSRLRFGYPLA